MRAAIFKHAAAAAVSSHSTLKWVHRQPPLHTAPQWAFFTPGHSRSHSENRQRVAKSGFEVTYMHEIETLNRFPTQAGRKTNSYTTVISQIRDDHKIYEFVNINQFYIDL